MPETRTVTDPPNPPEPTEVETCECHGCHESFPADSLASARADRRNSYLYCEDCFDTETFTCRHCDGRVTNDYGSTRFEDEDLCLRCEDEYRQCCDCDHVGHEDDMYYRSDRMEWYCENCDPGEEEEDDDDESYPFIPTTSRRDDDSDSLNIHSYSYDPLRELDFLGSPRDGLYLGAELEIDWSRVKTGRKEVVDAVLAACTWRGPMGRDHKTAVLKYDGSVNGFELVTAPMSIDAHRDAWGRLFGLRLTTNYGLRGETERSCGMHVHLSRSALSQVQLGKMLVFCGHPDNSRFLTWVAGRDANSYCQRWQKSVKDFDERGERYQAINLLKDSTIEFRIFASTLRLNRFLANLEFCHALATWAQVASLSALRATDFCEWMQKEGRVSYRYLADHLVEGEWLKPYRKPAPPRYRVMAAGREGVVV